MVSKIAPETKTNQVRMLIMLISLNPDPLTLRGHDLKTFPIVGGPCVGDDKKGKPALIAGAPVERRRSICGQENHHVNHHYSIMLCRSPQRSFSLFSAASKGHMTVDVVLVCAASVVVA